MPLDDRVREGLRRDVEPVQPDTERHLRSIRRRAEPGSGAIGWLAAAAAVFAVIAILIIGLRPAGVLVVPGTSTPPSLGPATSPSLSGAILEGTTWTVELLDADPGAPGLDMAGRWTLRLGIDSTAEVTPPDGFQLPEGVARIAGAYAIAGDGLVTNLFTRGFGAGCTAAGEYRFSVAAERLAFSGRDTCGVRRALLTTRSWTGEP